MYPSVHLPRFNYFRELIEKFWEQAYVPGKFPENQQLDTFELSDSVVEDNLEESRADRYQDLPYHSGDIASRLYYLNRRNKLNLEYFQDELEILNHMINKCPLFYSNPDHYELPRAQMLNKQLSFLAIQQNKIHEELEFCHSELKEAVQDEAVESLNYVKVEEARIDQEIDNFLESLAFTKQYLFQLLKKYSPVTTG